MPNHWHYKDQKRLETAWRQWCTWLDLTTRVYHYWNVPADMRSWRVLILQVEPFMRRDSRAGQEGSRAEGWAAVYKYLHLRGWCQTLSLVPSDRKRNNGCKLKHKKFHLSLRKNFFAGWQSTVSSPSTSSTHPLVSRCPPYTPPFVI